MNRKRRSLASYLVFASVVGTLALLPAFNLVPSEWYVPFIFANFFAIFAMSWDLLAGYAGQMNLGHALFIGVAAYTSGLAGTHLEWSPWVTIPLGMGASVIVGALIGIPAIRLRGPYLALVTLLALIAVYKLVLIYSDVTEGISGMSFTPKHFFPPLGYDVPLERVKLVTYYYSLGLMALIGAALLVIAQSRWGMIFKAIRDNEAAVEASGLNPAKFKVVAFMVSASAAGLAGAAYVHLPVLAALQPAGLDGVLSLDLSLSIIVASVVGGLGTIMGPLIGAYLTKLGQQYLSELPSHVEALHVLEGQGWISLLFWILLVFLVLFARKGLLPLLMGYLLRGIAGETQSYTERSEQ